jgi:hypothetical protein
MFPSHQQTAIVSQPGESALDFPPSLATSQISPILRFWLFTIAPVWTNHVNTALLQA